MFYLAIVKTKQDKKKPQTRRKSCYQYYVVKFHYKFHGSQKFVLDQALIGVFMKDWDDGIKNTNLNNTGNANHEVFQTPEKTEWSSQIRKTVWNKDYEMQWKKKVHDHT